MISNDYFENITGGTSAIKKMLWNSSEQFHDDTEKLIGGKSIQGTITPDLSYEDLTIYDDDTLLSLLYYAGYLTGNRSELDPKPDGFKELRVPNKEVMSEWEGWLSLPTSSFSFSLVQTILEGNIELFAKTLEDTVMKQMSIFDVGGSKSGKKAEDFYHGFVLGLLTEATKRGVNIRSNDLGGFGRYDKLLEEKSGIPNASAAIFEYKVVREKENIQKKVDDALKQIEDRQYRTVCSEHVRKLVECGIAFQGKKVMVKGRILMKQQGLWVVQDGSK
jgi:hypothetical protein